MWVSIGGLDVMMTRRPRDWLVQKIPASNPSDNSNIFLAKYFLSVYSIFAVYITIVNVWYVKLNCSHLHDRIVNNDPINIPEKCNLSRTVTELFSNKKKVIGILLDWTFCVNPKVGMNCIWFESKIPRWRFTIGFELSKRLRKTEK